ncbi:hypothetical protein Ancab_012788 [Ancistrocladus abbreviatus]
MLVGFQKSWLTECQLGVGRSTFPRWAHFRAAEAKPFLMVVVVMLMVVCDGTFTNGSSYANNLCTLENSLNYTTPWLGFGIGAVGVQDIAYGLALCRGDVDVDDYRTCVVKAITETCNLCLNDKGAII